jgi:hypothetical protein
MIASANHAAPLVYVVPETWSHMVPKWAIAVL